MNEKTTIYLDTSVINFLFADDAPDKKEDTIEFFENFIKTGIYNCFISDYVVSEIEDTREIEKRNKLLKVISDYGLEFLELPEGPEIDNLALEYVNRGIIPAKKLTDAYHIAICVICKINYLVSWNYKHMANVNKEKSVNVLNMENNYSEGIRIVTPLELMDYGSENI